MAETEKRDEHEPQGPKDEKAPKPSNPQPLDGEIQPPPDPGVGSGPGKSG